MSWVHISKIQPFYFTHSFKALDFPGDSDGKEFACITGDPGLIPGLGRSPGEGNGYPFQYFCLGNPTDRGAWRSVVHEIAKSQTWLGNQQFHLKKKKKKKASQLVYSPGLVNSLNRKDFSDITQVCSMRRGSFLIQLTTRKPQSWIMFPTETTIYVFIQPPNNHLCFHSAT